ncbi:MAG TPA: hypothetical protein VES42_29325 [Pilimelia sp.]|nr:hypothetical protein [Pilimelia sp.]
MFPHTHPVLLLDLHEQRMADLRAEAALYRLARAVSDASAHRRARWWLRLAGHRRAATRAPAHP